MISPTDDPEEAGARLRQSLGVTAELQASWSSHYDALNGWRAACEALGALVFQATRVDPIEMSGFSVSQCPLPVIVLNIRDVEQRRVFTLLHEAVHLATRRGGLCDLDERPGRGIEEQRLEVFCNHVAGAALVPLDVLRRNDLVGTQRDPRDWPDAEIVALARSLKVSREVIVRRLLVAGLATPEFYTAKREEFRQAYEGATARREGGPVPEPKKVLSRSGRLFTRLVLRAYHMERITTADVSEYLGLRAKHLPKLEQQVFGS
jgi:Zn-dependent peptidase ImmA (M78 family)